MTKKISFELLPHQKRLLDSQKNTAVLMGGRGCGKSVIISIMVFLHIIQGKRCMVFAQDFHALKYNLFNEIEKRFVENNLPVQVNKSDMVITTELNRNGICYGFSYQSVNSCRGTTEISLVCYDELCLAPIELFDIVNPCLRLPEGMGKARVIAATSPVAGSFYNKWCVSQEREGKLDLIRAKMTDNKFLDKESIALIEKSFTNEKMKNQEFYGEIYLDNDETAICTEHDFEIPEFNENEKNLKVIIGIDAAGTGQDKTVVCARRGHKIIYLQAYDKLTGYDALSEVNKICITNNLAKHDIAAINLDMAYSEGIYEALIPEYENTFQIPFAGKPPEKSYANMRAYGYMKLSSLIKDGLHITDRNIREELLNTHWLLDNYDRIIIQPKDEIKFVIKRSPDRSDALMLTCIEPENVCMTRLSPQKVNYYMDAFFRG